MSSSTSHEHEMLCSMVTRFVAEELMPHEELVDRLGEVPEDIGRQIEARGKEAGLFAANLPEAIGGGGLDYESMRIIEREFGKDVAHLVDGVSKLTHIKFKNKINSILKDN